MLFRDRIHAGRVLAERLREFEGRKDVLLLALPRGGVPVAGEVAKPLHLPLDVLVTRKIGTPGNPEYAIGALAETGNVIWNEDERAHYSNESLDALVKQEEQEAKRRIATYRAGRPLPDLSGKTVLIIDDGLATGFTMRAAVSAARGGGAERVIVAVPHGAADSIGTLKREADDVIAVHVPELYFSVGGFYERFPQTTDEEVLDILQSFQNNDRHSA